MKSEGNIFRELVSAWPSPFVAREEISRLTGGLLSPRYMANLDALGRGIPGRIRCGRKIVYRVSDVARFLESRASEVRS